MESRKELKQKYFESKPRSGVFQIKNIVSGKIFVSSNINIDAKWNAIKLQLDTGSFVVKELQKDWKEFGENNFIFETLDELEQLKDKETTDIKKDLAQLEKMWIEKLQPFGDEGYNN